jgi:hypothetical protein
MCRVLEVPSLGHTFVLVVSSTVVGRVITKATGAPIAGAEVRVSNRNGVHAPESSTRSDEAGAFRVSELPPGGYDITGAASGFRTATAFTSLGLGATSELVLLEVVPAPTPEARQALDAQPSHEARVDPGDSEPPSETIEPFGTIRASVDVPDEARGLVPVLVRARDGSPVHGIPQGTETVFSGLPLGEYTAEVEGAENAGERVVLTDSRPLATVRLRGPELLPVSGRVVGDDGQPVPGAWVTPIASRGTEAFSATARLTDGDGTFGFLGARTVSYSLEVTSELGEARVANVRAPSEVVVEIPSFGAISGMVATAGNAPVAAFLLEYGLEGSGSSAETPGFGASFSLPWTPPGTYWLRVRSEAGSASTLARVLPGKEARVRLLLRPGEDFAVDETTEDR